MQVHYITNPSGKIESAVIPIHIWKQLEGFLASDNFDSIAELTTVAEVLPLEETGESLASFFHNSPLFGVELNIERDTSPIPEAVSL